MTLVGLACVLLIVSRDIQAGSRRRRSGRGESGLSAFLPSWRPLGLGLSLGLAIALVGWNWGRPRLHGKIERIGFLSLTEDCSEEFNRPGARVLVVASIANTGPPTAVVNYRLRVEPPSGDESLPLIPVPIPESLNTIYQTGTPQIFTASDSLSRRTAEPLAKGAKVSGVLGFGSATASPYELTRMGMQYVLTFEDVVGRVSEVEQTWPAFSSCADLPRVKLAP